MSFTPTHIVKIPGKDNYRIYLSSGINSYMGVEVKSSSITEMIRKGEIVKNEMMNRISKEDKWYKLKVHSSQLTIASIVN